jgi:hypothetical protein
MPLAFSPYDALLRRTAMPDIQNQTDALIEQSTDPSVNPLSKDSNVLELGSFEQSAPTPLVVDFWFVAHLRLLMRVRERILYDRVHLEADDEQHLDLGYLNTLRPVPFTRSKIDTRRANLREWNDVEVKVRILTKYLSSEQLRKIQLERFSGFFIVWAAIIFSFAIFSLIVALSSADNPGATTFVIAYFVIWLATAGALGSAAFIYVNALSIQVDPSVDVMSAGPVMMRMVLGGLFGVILGLPFGFENFKKFSHNILSTNPSTSIEEGILLLLPFILGFSTPLVLAILNRFIQSIQTFFGVAQQADQGSSRPDLKPNA